MRVPDFFILGAPKCGTTALYSYLREHPGVFMPERKEPHYYATDFPNYRTVRSREAYLDLFAAAPDDALCGEASVWYLYSERAVANILKDNPEARFIVMLRNPVDLVHSLHWQKLQSLDEDVHDFETAWRLQAERARGRQLPRHCREPKHLQYRAACSFAPQIERLYAHVPQERVLALMFEDFAADPGGAYAETLRFLRLPHDGRQAFPKVNASYRIRTHLLTVGMRTTSRVLARTYATAKRRVNALGLRPGRAITRWNRLPQARPTLDARFEAELAETFSADVDRLEALLGRSLDVWRAAWRKIPPDARRIAFFLPSLRGDGAERASVTLACALAQRGLAVDVVLAKAEGPLLAEARAHARVIDLGASRVIASVPQLVRYFRREKPDTMMSVMGHANIVALWARRIARVSTRLVVSERNTWREDRDAQSSRERMLPLLQCHFYPWADGIVAVSQGVAEQLSRTARLPRDRITVIYNPVVRPQLTEKARQALEHPWFASNEPPVVLAVGRLTSQKDHPTLLRAFALLRQRGRARLLILGEGEARAELEQLIRTLGLGRDVWLPGYVDNPYAYMARAGVFVLSSAWEGLPGVLIEAMACGCPVVSTDCPSGPVEILEGGRFGRLVTVGDHSAMATAIGLALDEGRGDGTRAAQERAMEFNVEHATSAYHAVLFPSSGGAHQLQPCDWGGNSDSAILVGDHSSTARMPRNKPTI